jgi:hypothetical protein
VRYHALEAVSDTEVPLDQSADLLDRQASVLWDGVQHLLERLKGRESVKGSFHKLLLLLEWDTHQCLTSTAGCPSVASRYFQSKSAEGFPKSLVLRRLKVKLEFLLKSLLDSGESEPAAQQTVNRKMERVKALPM